MKMSIRRKLILIMLIIIVISISFVGVFAYNNAKNIIINEARNENYKTLQNANDFFLENFMSDMEYVVKYWAEDESVKAYRNKPNQLRMVRGIPDHFQDISNEFQGYIKSNPHIAWIYLGPEEDGSLFITPIDETMPEDYDCRERDWYKEAISNRGKTVWTEPYLDAGGYWRYSCDCISCNRE